MTTLINPRLAAHIDAVLAAGMTVYALPEKGNRGAGFVAVCLQEDGPFAHIQVPTHSFEPVDLDVPIKPSKDYGSSVLVDHDGTPEHAVTVLARVLTEPMVTVRFFGKRGAPSPKVPNYGRKCIEGWPGGAQFVKLEPGRANWAARQQAIRLDVGDRFIFDSEIDGPGDVVEVEARRYGGANYDTTIVTATDGRTISLPPGTFVTLAGAT